MFKLYKGMVRQWVDTYRKTKKALGGLLGLLGSFWANFPFLVALLLLLLSSLMGAFLLPTFLKIIEIYMIRHYNIPVTAVSTIDNFQN